MTDATLSRLADSEWTPYLRRYWGRRLPNSLTRKKWEPIHIVLPKSAPTPEPEKLPRRITVAEIARSCAWFAGLTVYELMAPSRGYRLCRPRQAAMYLAAKHTGKGTIAIGRLMGGRDHSTVHHARSKVQADLDSGGAIFGAIVAHVERELGVG